MNWFLLCLASSSSPLPHAPRSLARNSPSEVHCLLGRLCHRGYIDWSRFLDRFDASLYTGHFFLSFPVYAEPSSFLTWLLFDGLRDVPRRQRGKLYVLIILLEVFLRSHRAADARSSRVPRNISGKRIDVSVFETRV